MKIKEFADLNWLAEEATSGATASGSVATVVAPLGQTKSKKKKKDKVTVIRRQTN